MPQITSIEPQKKKKERLNIYVDGKFALGLSTEEVVKEKLEVGQEITPEEIKRLSNLANQQKLWEKALKFLSFRPRSQKEVFTYLLRKRGDEEEIKWVREKLRAAGYLDDEEFAKWWIEQRQTFRPKGLKAIKLELRQKGVSGEIIDQLFVRQGSEYVSAQKVAQKRLAFYKNLPRKEFYQKMGQYLARRGFEWETIKKVIDTIFEKE